VLFNDIDTGRGNIDHVLVGPAGVFLLESKNHRGAVSVRGGVLEVKWHEDPNDGYENRGLARGVRRTADELTAALATAEATRPSVQPGVRDAAHAVAAEGGRDGEVLPGTVVWIDIDDGEALERLREFAHRPHLVVASGSGGAHAYWRLTEEQLPAVIERANRMLCAALHGDLASTDAARIMRLPGTVNHKAGRTCRLLYADLARPGLALVEMTSGLVDPAPPAPPPNPALARRRELPGDDPAGDIAPPVYFRILAAIDVPERGGHVACPLPDHRDDVASCRVYSSPEEGWRCYGCQRGGTIYDLASLLERGPCGRSLRGEAFLTARRLVHEALGLDR
jgi:hypothetical protein